MFCRFNKITQIRTKAVFKITSFNIIRCESSAASVLFDYQNIPTPKALPLIGTTLALISSGGAPRLHIYADQRHRQLGPIFKDKIGPVTAVFLSDPHLMRTVFAQEGKCPVHILPEAWTLYNELHGCSRGLFFMDGDEWLHNRRIMNKLLLKGNAEWIDQACQVVSADLVNRWKFLSKSSPILPDLETELYRWSLNTVVSVLLGKQGYEMAKKELDPDLASLAKIIHRIFETSVPFQVFPAKLAQKLSLLSWKKFCTTVTSALNLSNVLVTKLLTIASEDGLLSKMKQEKILDKDITRIIVDLVLAAGDTTAYTMSWILYCLAKNDSIQQNIRQDFTKVKHAIRETLRLYPVAPFLTRVLPRNTTVAGYEIPAGTLTIFSIYTSGRDEKFFDKPDQFCPDRWLRENSTTNMQQVCIPFGFGARSCIGKRIADYQLQTSLVGILQNFQLQVDNDEEVDMILKMVAVPSQPIRLKLNRI
ncbi:cytochrome P450 315a1, mitochondrial [Photinus pyralis]|uniref:Cytochrome P450 n=1 Tax=Photinus pyralis TaxID=7054 RepID=A0A1Y1MMR8_PHOPY|nr:cytochrome P450 315a1, mitochondrial [Photinus pyralis]